MLLNILCMIQFINLGDHSLYKGNLGCFITSYENADKMVGYDFKIKNLNNNGEAVKLYLKK